MNKALRVTVLALILVVMTGIAFTLWKRGTISANTNTSLTTPTSPTPNTASGAPSLPPIQPCNPVPVDEKKALPAPATSGNSYIVLHNDSCLSYAVREKFVGKPLPTMAIGTTSTVAGAIEVAPDGSLKPFTITVDAGSFRSDEEGRDNKVRIMLTRSNQEPTANFVVTEFGKKAVVRQGESTKLLIKGNLQIRGTKKDLTIDAEILLRDDKLTITGTSQLKLTDVGLTTPSVAGLLTAENDVQLFVRIVAKKQ